MSSLCVRAVDVIAFHPENQSSWMKADSTLKVSLDPIMRASLWHSLMKEKEVALNAEGGNNLEETLLELNYDSLRFQRKEHKFF
ncbi:hypothetical protein CDAR_20191 [Caerostris darwini]|uniref:Uncharacterized protein n=1 Tax=Caerostris darwini TaxID=1538125 RepID=A0AAV4RQJ0_9ARAC|nr:hypothetical protein CDAR_20191 [Caerostris darwini]